MSWPAASKTCARSKRIAWPRFARALSGLFVLFFAATTAGFSEPPAASKRRGADEPPPVEDILKSAPATPSGQVAVELDTIGTRSHLKLSCGAANTNCLAMLAGMSLYNQLRRCGQLPEKAQISAEFEMKAPDGKSGAAAKTPSTKTPSISVGFNLKPDGTLAATPQIDVTEPSAALNALADAVSHAITVCQPFTRPAGLPYALWKNATMRLGLKG